MENWLDKESTTFHTWQTLFNVSIDCLQIEFIDQIFSRYHHALKFLISRKKFGTELDLIGILLPLDFDTHKTSSYHNLKIQTGLFSVEQEQGVTMLSYKTMNASKTKRKTKKFNFGCSQNWSESLTIAIKYF